MRITNIDKAIEQERSIGKGGRLSDQIDENGYEIEREGQGDDDGCLEDRNEEGALPC